MQSPSQKREKTSRIQPFLELPKLLKEPYNFYVKTHILLPLLFALVLNACAQAPLASPPTPAPAPMPAALPPVASSPQEPPVTTTANPPTPPVAAPASPETPEKAKSPVILGGALTIGLQNWSRVGSGDDSKMGFGLGGDFLIGTQIDETTKLLVGPHFSFNQWSADYSNKPNSVTDRVYVNMNDMGLNLWFDFGDMFLILGTGSSQLESAMVVNGVEIPYNFSGTEYGYKSFSLGFRSNSLFFSIGGVQYDGYAKYADRVEFNLGWMSF